MESPKLIQEPQDRSIKSFSSTSDAGKLWNIIEEKHQKSEEDMEELNEMIPILYLSLYRLLVEIQTLCPSNSAYMDVVIKQMHISKDRKRFEVDAAKDIVEGVNSIVEALVIQKSHSQIVDKPILEYNEKIKGQKETLANLNTEYNKVCGKTSVKLTTVALKEAGRYNGAVSLGIFATTLLMGGITAYRRSRNSQDMKELLVLMEEMSGKLEGLKSTSTFFSDKMRAIVDAMNRYAVRIEKIIRLASYKTDEPENDTERVIILAENIIENTNELKQKFDGMSREIKSILCGLRAIVLEYNPDANLDD